uniref:Ribosomal protein L2 C-terminal domain-containing protein n=1 Tax=Percolomonas cosmopolitus TaxID=63605 RepID=A0A7S1KTR7_9EUKA|mmetsp:Transcript_9352/g.34643  ORF Transcript_9352/g.34643 Transcript_9352/m.34643 type:complete len:426 (+) Transcript_9352:91-1368(+)|eukprot:CAMPEP_0117437116 /NCGR_PEP_ID=MMETSP0759-20121206/1356_1 /TAXON_ID=63605 /ORGANISM="Percolomonas cosmopolitus, Strain WS" /LENGTH=425 /DNA_ID=CAMNT_0005228735 /DNA_START=77 /DNA_END=1354 /DNA_ORIENTATION=+
MNPSTFLQHTKKTLFSTGSQCGSFILHCRHSFQMRAINTGESTTKQAQQVEQEFFPTNQPSATSIDTKKGVLISNIYQLPDAEGNIPAVPQYEKHIERPGLIAVPKPILIKKKPTSNGMRNTVLLSKKHMAKKGFAPLILGRARAAAGRNHHGKITVRRRQGGHKKRYRLVDFKRDSINNVPAVVQRIDYDPLKQVNLALVYYKNGVFSYIPATAGMKVGDVVYNQYHPDTDPLKLMSGDRTLIKYLPSNTMICNLEYTPGRGAQMLRSGGTFATVLHYIPRFNVVQVKMPTGKILEICGDCKATIGQSSGAGHVLQNLGKAGRNRWLGVRPHVRGVAMNPVDHPHGGGEGKSSMPSTPLNWKGRPQKAGRAGVGISGVRSTNPFHQEYHRMLRALIRGRPDQSNEMKEVMLEIAKQENKKRRRK